MWMGVTGGAMAGVTSRGGGDKNTCNYNENQQRERVLAKGSTGQGINKRLTEDAL